MEQDSNTEKESAFVNIRNKSSVYGNYDAKTKMEWLQTDEKKKGFIIGIHWFKDRSCI